MTDCTAYHDVFRTIPVLEYILKMGREPRLLLLACDTNMSTGKDTTVSHKNTELHIVTAINNMLSLKKIHVFNTVHMHVSNYLRVPDTRRLSNRDGESYHQIARTRSLKANCAKIDESSSVHEKSQFDRRL